MTEKATLSAQRSTLNVFIEGAPSAPDGSQGMAAGGGCRRILILGSTGSIGRSACNCVRRFREDFKIVGLAAGGNVGLLVEQVAEFSPEAVYIRGADDADAIRERFGNGVRVYDGKTTLNVQRSTLNESQRIKSTYSGYDGDGGNSGLVRMVEECDYDILLNALVGAVGFGPTVAALRRGKRVALANKESLVIGGEYIRTIIDENRRQRACKDPVMHSDFPLSSILSSHDNTGGSSQMVPSAIGLIPDILPIDSEHSAILQCLPQGGSQDAAGLIESVIITASGGPFREMPKSALAGVTPKQALAHPTWAMGRKITVDSSTLMNKGFELIEAHHLFSLPYNSLRVYVHPQSVIHSLVEFRDGAVVAQLGLPDMELPIQYALSWPNRLPIPGKRLSLPAIRSLEFFEPDTDKFPCLRLCIEAGMMGGTAPTAINAANEVAVDLFLNGKIGFTDIARIVETALKEHNPQKADSVEVIEGVDREVRDRVLGRG